MERGLKTGHDGCTHTRLYAVLFVDYTFVSQVLVASIKETTCSVEEALSFSFLRSTLSLEHSISWSTFQGIKEIGRCRKHFPVNRPFRHQPTSQPPNTTLTNLKSHKHRQSSKQSSSSSSCGRT
jgi:hypothetical protein